MEEVEGFALVIGKNGPRLTQSSGPEKRPGVGITLSASPGQPGTITGRSLDFVNVSMDTIANALASQIGRPVVNKTGLKGNYDFVTAQFSLDEVGQNPSVFAAMDEAGLKIEKRKVMRPVLVIEHLERPYLN
jgi:uncharacterized protein (TIGR03435 family)